MAEPVGFKNVSEIPGVGRTIAEKFKKANCLSVSYVFWHLLPFSKAYQSIFSVVEHISAFETYINKLFKIQGGIYLQCM